MARNHHHQWNLCALAVTIVVVGGAGGSGCSCGDPAVVYDIFQPDGNPQQDALHTYASHAQVPLKVRSNDAFRGIDAFSDPEAGGSVSVDPETDVTRTEGGTLEFTLLTGDAGDGTVSFKDRDGNEITSRTLTIVDVDELALAVTAPATAGLELPDVDPANVRIYAGGKAAFRTTLSSSGDEVVGLQAVALPAAAAGLSSRNGTGCAGDSCDAARNAVEIAVAAGTTDEADVALTAGSATLTVHVVPTADADITDVVMDEADLVNGKGSLVAHVLAADEPVFGALVEWQIDDETLLDQADVPQPQHGDALQFNLPPPSSNPNEHPAAHDVKATIAGQDASTSVSGQDFSVTSITSCCGAVPGSFSALFGLLALLGIRKRTRR